MDNLLQLSPWLISWSVGDLDDGWVEKTCIESTSLLYKKELVHLFRRASTSASARCLRAGFHIALTALESLAHSTPQGLFNNVDDCSSPYPVRYE